MKAFKGFDKNMQCRGFQFEEGKTYTEQYAALCSQGFHFVELPLDAFTYYKPADGARYATVVADGVSDERESDSKRVATQITVGAEIGIPGLIKAHVQAIFERVKKPSKKTAATTGDSAHAATTGDYAHAATTGYSAHAATTGYYAHAATTGYSAHAATTGYSAHAATTGYYAHAATTGRSANAATTGDYAHAATAGYSAHAATTGYSANAATTGRYANAATTGYSAQIRASVKDADGVAAVLGQGAASGVVGSVLFLIERDQEWNIVAHKSVRVDGKKYRADVFYTLRDGKVVEA